jgi:hypothetical protein
MNENSPVLTHWNSVFQLFLKCFESFLYSNPFQTLSYTSSRVAWSYKCQVLCQFLILGQLFFNYCHCMRMRSFFPGFIELCGVNSQHTLIRELHFIAEAWFNFQQRWLVLDFLELSSWKFSCKQKCFIKSERKRKCLPSIIFLLLGLDSVAINPLKSL